VLDCFAGKTFLNSIEYLDEKTNEWTTFVPKLVAEDRVGAFCPDMMQENGILLESIDLQPEQENETSSRDSVHVHENGRISHKDTNPVEETVLPRRKRSQNNSRDACHQNARDGGVESHKRVEPSS
jgi:hypothetical protein